MQQSKSSKIATVIFKVFLVLVFTVTVGAGSFLGGYYYKESKINEETRTLDWVISMVKQKYYTDFTTEEIINAATAGIEELLDPYSTYFSKEEYAAYAKSQQGYRAGIGVVFSVNKQGEGVIYRVHGGSPAEAAGFRKNEVVLGLRLPSLGGDFTSTPTYNDFSNLLNTYPENTDIDFLMRSDEQQVIRTVQKAQFRQRTVTYYNKENLSILPENTAYIRFDTFTGTAEEDFANAMNRYKTEGKTKLILDLRDNGGGSVSILCNIAAYLIKSEKGKQNVVMKAAYKSHVDDRFVSAPSVYADYTFNEIKVLINGNSASATEALVGAMLDYGTITYADLFGATSYGKGIMQTTYSHTLHKDAIKLTTARIVWPISDTCIHDKGIIPANFVVENSTMVYRPENDLAIKAAVSTLQ
ncbi:MAG: hypothetical protein II368_06845 [Clostridia bacterium]|nr:hypothetical protein [Clostridia bacterium]